MKDNFNFHGDEHDKEIDKILDEYREDNHLNTDDEFKSVGKYDFDMFMPKSNEDTSRKDYYGTDGTEDTGFDGGTFDDDTIIDDDFVIKPHEPVTATAAAGTHGVSSGTAAHGKSGKKGKGKKKRSHAWIVSVIVQIGFIVGLSVFFSWAIITTLWDMLALGKNEYCEVVIEQDATTAEIADALEEAGAIDHPWLFRMFAKFKGVDGTLRSGVYNFYNSIGYEGIISQLQEGGLAADEVTVTIPEGATLETIKTLLVEAGACTADSFDEAVASGEFNYDFIEDIPVQRVYYRLEGYLYPETYNFYKDDTDQSGFTALNKLISQLDTVFTDEMKARADELGYSMHEVLTLASIVELEASGDPENMAKVAAVFYNRLNWTDQPKLLGSTPTVTYAQKAGIMYNTMVTEGLPPGPICNPGIDAINAVLYPEENFDYDYFVTDTDKVFYYSKTLDEHNAVIAQLRREGKWQS